MHHVLVGYVTIREKYLVDMFVADQARKLLLGADRDAFGVVIASQLGWVCSAFNVGDLGSGESDHLIGRVAAQVGVEIMEVPPGSPHDQNALLCHIIPFSLR